MKCASSSPSPALRERVPSAARRVRVPIPLRFSLLGEVLAEETDCLGIEILMEGNAIEARPHGDHTAPLKLGPRLSAGTSMNRMPAAWASVVAKQKAAASAK